MEESWALGGVSRACPLGIVRRARAGTSREFHELRDYRDGDPLAQIDWNATSRRQRLISRDYQEQRNQAVVFLVDTGRRMRALDGALPQFDHALNAILLVSHVALKQGDQVAVESFGGEERWLPPVKGAHAMPVPLNLAADRYLNERREIMANLAASGVLTLDTTAQELAIAIANRYLDIKAAGRL